MKLENKLCILKNLENDPLMGRYFSYLETECEDAYAIFLNRLFDEQAEDNFYEYVIRKILFDENAFSVTCANKKTISPYLLKAYANDLKKIYTLTEKNKGDENYATGEPKILFANTLFDISDEETMIKNLEKFYAKYGFGQFISTKAFRFDKELTPIKNPASVTLSDLKDYKDEKKIISSNIENFICDLPFSNMLLYGERGTGKSSTVHAMVNKYFSEGLRIVELSKENMLSLNILREKISSIPLKFIIYIDDLSLNSGDERISSLKASLEGSADCYFSNSMVVASSNRRHIVNEKFSERDDSVHSGDSMQEELSLYDRFGISVLFSATSKKQYLSIVFQLAEDKKLNMSKETLELLSERWALQKGGRSPRRAKQFIDIACAAQAKGSDVEF